MYIFCMHADGNLKMCLMIMLNRDSPCLELPSPFLTHTTLDRRLLLRCRGLVTAPRFAEVGLVLELQAARASAAASPPRGPPRPPRPSRPPPPAASPTAAAAGDGVHLVGRRGRRGRGARPRRLALPPRRQRGERRWTRRGGRDEPTSRRAFVQHQNSEGTGLVAVG